MRRPLIPIIGFLSSLAVFSCAQEEKLSSAQFAERRADMVKTQLEARGVKDQKVLAAMNKVERHLFVPEGLRSRAYGDFPLPIGEEQTISQPYIVALMTEVLVLDKNDKVLEIGAGSGYQAAILGEMAKQVYSIEIIASLGKQAAALLKKLGYQNIEVKVGDGYQGWPEHAPFNAIIVTCAPTRIPQPLQDQLAEGGRMVIPVGADVFNQELILLTKKNGRLRRQAIVPVRFVPMIDKDKKAY